MSGHCFVEFVIPNEKRLAQLVAILDELRADKQSGSLAPGPKWNAMFDESARAHFWWPTEAEYDEWLRRWYATPVDQRATEPSLKKPWLLDAVIEAFANGEYELLGIQRDGGRARLEFEPVAYPYGGTGCMKALVEAHECRVTLVDDGSQPPFVP